MRNIISAEFIKVRKNYAVFFSTLLVIAVPIFMIIVPVAPPYYTSWVMTNILFTICMVLPIMSGFVVTIMIQREYQDQTIINVLVSPVARSTYIFSKLIMWLIWYVITLLIIIAIYILGLYILYQEIFNINSAVNLANNFAKSGILSFIASLPLMLVIVMQRKTFYPSLITVLIFTTIQVGATQVSESTILLASITPWSAVTLISALEIPMPYFVISIISIFTIGIMGLILTCFSFIKQDQ